MSAVIELEHVGKRYRQLVEGGGLRSRVPFVRSDGAEELWALRDLSLRVEPGELLGVLGHNGAGKTTLLRLLAGVTAPSEGRIRVAGRIAPLISIGVGFHQEMTGRENVFVNGMLLGLSAPEVAARLDDIVDFAELADVIDTPVKFYSSGMQMRLGFSVVIHIDPAVLLVDEILAVGDAAFQLKCFERLRQFRDDGAAILVVSHAIHTVRQLARRAVLIQHGRLVFDGDVEQAIALHYESASELTTENGDGLSIEVVSHQLLGADGGSHHANYGDAVAIELHLRFHRDVLDAELEFTLRTEGGDVITSTKTPLTEAGGFKRGEEGTVRIEFVAYLGAGNYRPAFQMRTRRGDLLGAADGLVLFVAGRPASIGTVDLQAEIEIDGVDRTDRRATLL